MKNIDDFSKKVSFRSYLACLTKLACSFIFLMSASTGAYPDINSECEAGRGRLKAYEIELKQHEDEKRRGAFIRQIDLDNMRKAIDDGWREFSQKCPQSRNSRDDGFGVSNGSNSSNEGQQNRSVEEQTTNSLIGAAKGYRSKYSNSGTVTTSNSNDMPSKKNSNGVATPDNLTSQFSPKDPNADYTGKSCAYFTKPEVEVDGGRMNYYSNDSIVCYGSRMYICKARHWAFRGPCTSFKDWEASSAETLER